MQFINSYAVEGLRTLLLAKRKLDASYYAAWSNEFQKASTSVLDRENLLYEISAKIEQELVVIGSTAIEDKLQEGVPETIRLLRETGIIIWVLTGDKIETAINIGFSAKLLDNSMYQVIIQSNDDTEILNILKQALTDLKERKFKGQETAIIIAGDSLTRIEKLQNLLDLLLEATDLVNVVVACRVSPSQKAEIVQMVRQKHP